MGVGGRDDGRNGSRVWEARGEKKEKGEYRVKMGKLRRGVVVKYLTWDVGRVIFPILRKVRTKDKKSRTSMLKWQAVTVVVLMVGRVREGLNSSTYRHDWKYIVERNI